MTVVATDVAGNTATIGTNITLDRDLDRDGIENNVDGNSSVSPGVSQATIASARFSDKARGGSTSGRITAIPAGMTVSIADHPIAARGVLVTVAGAAGQRATLRLDGKGSQIRLRSPGTYVVTDPSTTTIVETIQGGPAEVEVTVAGTLLVIAIDAGEKATITEIDNDGNGTVDNVIVTPGAGDVITVNGAPIVAAGLNLGALVATKLEIQGRRAFELGTVLTGGAINPLTEPVTIKVGTFLATIPPGSFVVRRGTYRFSGTIAGAKLAVGISPLGIGRYGISVEATGVNLAGVVNPVLVQVTVGDDGGIASVRAKFE